ncbi:hypothetical protein BX257_5647 [Streptomyces sp. 3212.3]|nr:hypothetical protein BX257_5647 [Streptomyces sp. 3212.3]
MLHSRHHGGSRHTNLCWLCREKSDALKLSWRRPDRNPMGTRRGTRRSRGADAHATRFPWPGPLPGSAVAHAGGFRKVGRVALAPPATWVTASAARGGSPGTAAPGSEPWRPVSAPGPRCTGRGTAARTSPRTARHPRWPARTPRGGNFRSPHGSSWRRRGTLPSADRPDRRQARSTTPARSLRTGRGRRRTRARGHPLRGLSGAPRGRTAAGPGPRSGISPRRSRTAW